MAARPPLHGAVNPFPEVHSLPATGHPSCTSPPLGNLARKPRPVGVSSASPGAEPHSHMRARLRAGPGLLHTASGQHAPPVPRQPPAVPSPGPHCHFNVTHPVSSSACERARASCQQRAFGGLHIHLGTREPPSVSPPSPTYHLRPPAQPFAARSGRGESCSHLCPQPRRPQGAPWASLGKLLHLASGAPASGAPCSLGAPSPPEGRGSQDPTQPSGSLRLGFSISPNGYSASWSPSVCAGVPVCGPDLTPGPQACPAGSWVDSTPHPTPGCHVAIKRSIKTSAYLWLASSIWTGVIPAETWRFCPFLPSPHSQSPSSSPSG